VRRDRQAAIHPLAISHGANAEPVGRSRFRLEADWTGTPDPTAHLAVPAAIAFGATFRPGGWPATMAAGRALALEARDRLCAALGIAAPAPDTMIGSMAALPIPGPVAAPDRDPLGLRLYERHRIEVPIVGFPVPAALDPGRDPARRLVRVSAAPYNVAGEYDRLAEALVAELEAEATLGRRGGG
jgi:isopenicillin-N epimerase